MIETKVICDGCKAEIDTKTNYAEGYYLVMSSVPKSPRGPSVYAASENSPVETMHFCGKNCVGRWYHES